MAIDELCEKLPRRAWKLVSQMQAAANSVHSNIAEGNGRFSTADYLRHLGISNASLNELESDLHFLVQRRLQDIKREKRWRWRWEFVSRYLDS